MKFRPLVLLIVVIVLGSLCGLSALTPAGAQAARPQTNGFSVWPSSATSFGGAEFSSSVTQMKAMGFTDVSMIIPYEQNDYNASTMHPRGDTPTDAALAAGIDTVHAQGMRAVPKLYLELPFQGGWRSYIDPTDRATWYRQYGDALVHYATIAQAHHAEMFVIGTEMGYTADSTVNQDNTVQWISIIRRVRSVYSGHLTYALDWHNGSPDRIGFWNYLDSIGVSSYFQMVNDCTSNPTTDQLIEKWRTLDQELFTPFATKIGKPLFFSEIGYGSHASVYCTTWIAKIDNPNDEAGQAKAYQAFYSYWGGRPNMIGVNFWNWCADSRCSHETRGYTVQGKAAEAVARKGFASNAVTPPMETNYSTALSLPALAVTSRPVALKLAISTSTSVTTAIVDLELYDSSGKKVFQQASDNQTLGTTAKIYQTSWTPTQPGTYTAKVGIFEAGWQKPLYWNGSAGTVTVKGATPSPAPTPTPQPTPSPTSSAIELWWPTNGSTLSGIQPFKAVISGLDVSQYSLTWQVDNGAENVMLNSPIDFSHKEFVVDLSGWNWNAGGPYRLLFKARNAAGQTIAQRISTIFVTR